MRKVFSEEVWSVYTICDCWFEVYRKGDSVIISKVLPDFDNEGEEIYRIKVRTGNTVLFNGYVWDWYLRDDLLYIRKTKDDVEVIVL